MTARDAGPSLCAASDGSEPAALAMARDVLLAGRVADGEAGLVVRTHGWAMPCISFGRAQSASVDALAALAAAGVQAVRRPTGGGWLLHLPGDLAVTLAVAPGTRAGSLRDAAREVARAIAGGLEDLGIPAALTTGDTGAGRAARAEICFARKDPDEVEADGVKLAGVALGRVRRAVLVQSAIPLVPADGPLAALASTWDPLRAAAAARLAGLDEATLASSIAARLAGGRPVTDWTWTAERAAAAAALSARMSMDGENGMGR